MTFLLSILALVVVGAVVSCGGDDNTASTTPTKAAIASTTTAATVAATGTPTPAASGGDTVDVALQEWSINPSVLTIGAGAVTFNVNNSGPLYKHEFVVLKTDLAAAALPKKADGSVDEEGAGVESPGEIADLAIGGQESATIDVTPGKYLFICNLVDQDATAPYVKSTVRNRRMRYRPSDPSVRFPNENKVPSMRGVRSRIVSSGGYQLATPSMRLGSRRVLSDGQFLL